LVGFLELCPKILAKWLKAKDSKPPEPSLNLMGAKEEQTRLRGDEK
jgi:hypothetical protein